MLLRCVSEMNLHISVKLNKSFIIFKIMEVIIILNYYKKTGGSVIYESKDKCLTKY
jgi:hypothetical protein